MSLEQIKAAEASFRKILDEAKEVNDWQTAVWANKAAMDCWAAATFLELGKLDAAQYFYCCTATPLGFIANSSYEYELPRLEEWVGA